MNKKVVGIIPIKLNNQRLPGKNTMKLGNKVLCQYLFDTVKQVKLLDEVYVYCSDDSICQYIPDGIRFLKRSSELDLDEVKSKDILERFINEIDAEIYVLMHVTQPYIKQETISKAIEMVKIGGYDSAIAAREIKEFAWYQGKPVNYSLDDVVRTQQLEPVYIEGELFVFEKEVFTEKGRRIGDKPYIHAIDWIEDICIDTREDFEMAEAVVKLKGI